MTKFRLDEVKRLRALGIETRSIADELLRRDWRARGLAREKTEVRGLALRAAEVAGKLAVLGLKAEWKREGGNA